MKIVFLDYDGVVNSLIFSAIDEEPDFNFPSDNKVNNFQAVCWLNKLCKETGAKIVVTSTWRLYKNYKECLYNGGLKQDIEILGRTENLGTKRGLEIQKWLDDNKSLEIDKFVILDDDTDMEHLTEHLVLCNSYSGMDYNTYDTAIKMLNNE